MAVNNYFGTYFSLNFSDTNYLLHHLYYFQLSWKPGDTLLNLKLDLNTQCMQKIKITLLLKRRQAFFIYLYWGES